MRRKDPIIDKLSGLWKKTEGVPLEGWMARALREESEIGGERGVPLSVYEARASYPLAYVPNQHFATRENGVDSGLLYIGGLGEEDGETVLDARWDPVLEADLSWSRKEGAPVFFLTEERFETPVFLEKRNEKKSRGYVLSEFSLAVPKEFMTGRPVVENYFGIKPGKGGSDYVVGAHTGILAVPVEGEMKAVINSPAEKATRVVNVFDHFGIDFADYTAALYAPDGTIPIREASNFVRHLAGERGRIYEVGMKEFRKFLRLLAPNVVKHQLKKMADYNDLDVELGAGKRPLQVALNDGEIESFFDGCEDCLDCRREEGTIRMTVTAAYRMPFFTKSHRKKKRGGTAVFHTGRVKSSPVEKPDWEVEIDTFDGKGAFVEAFQAYSRRELGDYRERVRAIIAFKGALKENKKELGKKGKVEFYASKKNSHDAAPVFVHNYHCHLKNFFDLPDELEVRSEQTSGEKGRVEMRLERSEAAVKKLKAALGKMNRYARAMSYLNKTDRLSLAEDFYSIVFDGEVPETVGENGELKKEAKEVLARFAQVFPVENSRLLELKEKTKEAAERYCGE